jgi:phytoene/squalene synthetase
LFSWLKIRFRSICGTKEVALLGPILTNLIANRRRPSLSKLQAIRDPDQFLWQILPHAARTFSLVIVFLPRRMRRALAVAYLYCRMLDTYEDLLPTLEEQQRALKRFVERFTDRKALAPAANLDPGLSTDARERTHLLLVNRAAFIDWNFNRLSAPQQEAIRRLVKRMGEGMIWSSRIFAEQDGVLQTPGQLSRYCWHVLGTPILFAEEIQRLDQGLSPEISDERLRSCAVIGEVIQLANITRDLEKDYRRGIFYHPDLPGFTGARREQVIREVRAQLVLRALRQAPEFRTFIEALTAPRISLARGAAILLVITTYAYYWRAAQKAGVPAFDRRQRVTRLGGAFTWVKCVLSRQQTSRFLRWLEKTAVIAFDRCQPPASKRFIFEDGEFDVVQVMK